ncbi:O-antigen ligase family protein [Aquimarina latercula]|uniref:O-antigen ligase family protein n=1 Tax=Aquimarina latercula TaxID=987 RepID=UPI001FDFB061|nr:O-antigen ligase family protein [Aquimarina latercula]
MFSLLKIRRLTIHKILRFFPFVVLAACLYSHTVTIIRFISNNEPSLRHFFNLNYSYGALGNTLDLHTTYYSIYILFAITIILENFKNLKSIIHKILYLLLIGYFSSFILQLASRVSIVTLYLIFLFFSIRFIYEKRQIMKGIFVIIVFHVLLFIIGSNMSITKYRFQHIFGFTYYTGYTVNDGQHKLNLWTAAINANDNLLIGNGVGDIQPSLNASYKENGLTKPLKENYNSHNQYIEFYVGLGIIGLLFFLYLLFYYGYLFLKTKNYLGVQFIILIAIISFTECIWNRHNGIVFICFLIGLLVGQSLSLDEDSDRPRLSF